MTVDQYLQLRLGPGPLRKMVKNMFWRAFTAPSLRAFWKYWNPGYGYYLLVYCYQPLRRLLPDALAMIATFLFCGFFLHDVLYLAPMILSGEPSLPIPFITCWFLLISLGVVVTDWLGIHFRGLRSFARVVIHVGFLAITFGLTFYINSLV